MDFYPDLNYNNDQQFPIKITEERILISAAKKDLIKGFADAINLISPEVQDHHEKTAYLACRLAGEMGFGAEDSGQVFFGALLHDIGGIMNREKLTLMDLEKDALAVSAKGAAFLRMFPDTAPYADVVGTCQIPWRILKDDTSVTEGLKTLGQIIHLADVITLLLNESEYVLNQIGCIRERIRMMEGDEFSPAVTEAFDALCKREYVWMDVLYRPECFIDLAPAEGSFSLEKILDLTEIMSKIIDFRSPFTAMHSAGVAATAVSLAELMGMSEDECRMMRVAGNLHDVGKLRVSNAILEKPGKLTDEEFNIMKEHAYYTYMILKDIRGFHEISEWAAFHHEKLSGTGYPFHLREKDISLGSRIMTVADIFSAITEDRPYRKGMEPEQAKSILREDADRGFLCKAVTDLLIGNFDRVNECRARASGAAGRVYREISG